MACYITAFTELPGRTLIFPDYKSRGKEPWNNDMRSSIHSPGGKGQWQIHWGTSVSMVTSDHTDRINEKRQSLH